MGHLELVRCSGPYAAELTPPCGVGSVPTASQGSTPSSCQSDSPPCAAWDSVLFSIKHMRPLTFPHILSCEGPSLSDGGDLAR